MPYAPKRERQEEEAERERESLQGETSEIYH
jgi:hypothetical protein